MEKIKILYIVSTLKKCGPVNQLYNIVNNIDKTIFEPVVCTLSPETENSLLDTFEKSGVKIIKINLSRLSGIFLLGYKVRKIIKEYDVDIVHSSGLRADAVNAYLKDPCRKLKRIATIRNNPFDDYIMYYGKISGFIYSLAHIHILKKIPLPVACSVFIQTVFLRKYKIKCFIVNNGVDTSYYKPAQSNDEKMELRKKYNLPLNRTIFLYTGPLIKRKDAGTLIKGFIKLDRDDCLLILAGSLNPKDFCNYDLHESIIFTGYVNEIIDYYRLSDIIVSASLSEGLPNSILEAMSVNLSAVLSDIEAHLPFRHENVLFFKQRDYEDLAIKMNEAISFTGVTTGDFIVKNFSAYETAGNYEKLYLSE